YNIVAVSDSSGGIYRKEGFHVPSLIKLKNERRQLEAIYCENDLCEKVEAETITNEELLQLDVDILIPAALEDVITEKNAPKIKAETLVEVANGPVTSAADPILKENGVFVIPDILANAGGVTVSYFEWVQNKAGYYWTEKEVHDRLEERMSKEYWAIFELTEKHDIDMRTAAYAHALSRIGKALTAQGTKDYFQNGKH
ncbi:MAG: glutamate dehydrogenase, partial [Verrucomicrobiae bacterium]|nr:glutamate dehydrogenase [Verrucomicrobiae bacterium]